MRAPLLGACLARRAEMLREFVHASTRLTHVDPRAAEGAWVVAHAAAEAVLKGPDTRPEEFLESVLATIEGDELRRSLNVALDHLRRGDNVSNFAASLGLERGVSGYINHTVPVVIFCWLRHLGDFRATVESAILLGGDADSTGAIAGALAGASAGRSAIPGEWLSGLWEWPRTVSYMDRLAHALASFSANVPRTSTRPPRWFWLGVLARNLVMFLLVLAHGFRRLGPPY